MAKSLISRSFGWIRKRIKKKPVDLGKRWRYAPDGVTKIPVED